MKFVNWSPEEFFPLLQQTLVDAFKLDSYLMHSPYLDYEKMDMGFRRMVWGDYKTNSPLFSLSGQSLQTPYQMIVLQSSLDFYNLIVRLTPGENPVILGIMPFRTESISQVKINRLLNDNGIDLKHTASLLHFYRSIPIVDIEELTLMLKHFISFFIPEFSSCNIGYVNYKPEHRELSPSENRYQKFTSDYIAELISRLEKCSRAMTTGNTALASDHLKKAMDYSASFESLPMQEVRKNISALNIFLASRMFETAVHPVYVYQQAEAFSLRIKEATTPKALAQLPFDIVRKYSILARNYTYSEYSYLIRSVINYIDQHLSSDLSLCVLAEEFKKNPSYLSNTFKKEVGETLTSYVGKQRIQAALRCFNTTSMNITDVSENVGISNFGYFSKLFKKYVGISPREYKKMLDK